MLFSIPRHRSPPLSLALPKGNSFPKEKKKKRFLCFKLTGAHMFCLLRRNKSNTVCVRISININSIPFILIFQTVVSRDKNKQFRPYLRKKDHLFFASVFKFSPLLFFLPLFPFFLSAPFLLLLLLFFRFPFFSFPVRPSLTSLST